MNVTCGVTSSIKWIKGWRLRSGGFANLCDHCGSAYELSVFCDTFHLKESGWRECYTCNKRLHCGCIASKALLVLADNGGVQCISCIRSLELSIIRTDEKPAGISMMPTSNVGELQLTSLDYKMGGDDIGVKELMLSNMEGKERNNFFQSQRDDANGSLGQIKREQGLPLVGEVGSTTFSTFNEAYFGSTQLAKQNNHKDHVGGKDMYESLAQTCLTMTLGVSPGATSSAQPHASSIVEGREQSRMSLQQGQRPRPRTSKMGLGTAPEASKDNHPQLRVARPPIEGRGRNQLLPSSNSTIVPLFEKVLSASDAGRIGRLVLPKACAEAYFPPISQPEGLALRIQDVKGKEWQFQFRFWPNNNSRMYVLEGVTPCIHSMQLQAGDTVTFSRLDPEGKLVMGFRKSASNSASLKDTQPAVSNAPNENFFSGVIENLPRMSGQSGLQSFKGSTDPHLNVLSERLYSADGDANLCKVEKQEGRLNEGLSLQPLLTPEKKRSRNIGSKSKRLLIDNEDALELKLTWEEAHDLLRPPPRATPSIVKIEDYDFEEYEEAPIFGKRTIFTSGSSGGQDQWAQCDSCSKWRRLPVDVFLPVNWTCSENAWDSQRCSCSVPNELSPMELENLLRLNMDFKRRKVASQPVHDHEPSGLDALATAAVLGDNRLDVGTSLVATTTKHPRHRPGCTCIVCIQPPSGKGPKHKPTCTCNVCMTVKRRFKTLMMRKKKRQSEKEAEVAQSKNQIWCPKDEEVESASQSAMLVVESSENEGRQVNMLDSSDQTKVLAEKTESSKAHLDLNFHPEREDSQAVSARISMMGLLQVANRPLETYLRQNGLSSLATEQQASSGSHAPPQAIVEGEERPTDDGYCPTVPPQAMEQENEQEHESEHEHEKESGGDMSDDGLDKSQSQNEPV
ncbi:B3 domain-containing transcription repressor val1 [Thalictrum thalictroides]|uniref:B3 domain-containing transcription repressor val1 n=1 Tax=Thalictrum thalictroides TaxID=46969 RepID=A0A7J6XEK8_THATH|nr:B3 domain-containing transcription repressor val1 [Thalictrum thalictroides]